MLSVNDWIDCLLNQNTQKIFEEIFEDKQIDDNNEIDIDDICRMLEQAQNASNNFYKL